MNSRHALGKLIESAQISNGWSDRDLGERASKLGLEIAKSNFSRLKNQPLNSIKGSLVAGLSLVLDVPEQKVAQAALESMGVRGLSAANLDLESAVRMESSLPKHDKDILLAVIEKMRAIEKERGGNVSTAPNKRAGESPARDEFDLAASTDPAVRDRIRRDEEDGRGEESQEYPAS